MAASSDGLVIPAAFKPPVDSRREFIKRELDDEDERIEVGVAIVGGGPAGLACANRLLQLLADEPELLERLGEVPVAVIEKGKACGAHNLSGAMMRPSGLQALFPDLSPSDWPTYGQVAKDAVYWMLSPKRALPLKPTPPPFRNHGNYVVSVAELSRWLAEKAEEAGAYILTETSAHQLLVEDGVVRGIRSGDKGRGKDGEPLGNFEPGTDIKAHATVLAIDLPSGLDCDTGQPLGPACVRADKTVTFVAEKSGFANPDAREYTGEITVADIGCPIQIIEEVRAAGL